MSLRLCFRRARRAGVRLIASAHALRDNARLAAAPPESGGRNTGSGNHGGYVVRDGDREGAAIVDQRRRPAAVSTPVEVANCACGVMLVHQRGTETRFLILRAYNYWDFPKGLMELGETPIEAALREVLEETGQQDLSFPWGTDCYITKPYAGGKVAHYFLARTRSDRVRLGVNPTLGRPEHQEYRWVTAIEAHQLLNDRVYGALQWAFQRMKASRQRG